MSSSDCAWNFDGEENMTIRQKRVALFIVGLAAVSLAQAAESGNFAPGKRTLMLAHNAMPEEGKWADRFERVIGTGMPFAVEIDLAWAKNPKTGATKSFVGPGPKELNGDEPSLKTFFFERIGPTVEQALKANNKKDWPLVTLFLDIKNDPPEHLESVWNVLGEYEAWLTTAVKTKDIATVAPFDVKPIVVLVLDSPNKEEFFCNRVPVGAKLRVFASAKLASPPGSGLSRSEIFQLQTKMKPEGLLIEPANNYRRWWHNTWVMVEPMGLGPGHGPTGEFTAATEARLESIVNHAHKMGYLINLYVLDGVDPAQGRAQGWEDSRNFGSFDKAMIRWKAAAKAGADFISTDQYEDVAKVIKKGN
jgi:hypothetical protein